MATCNMNPCTLDPCGYHDGDGQLTVTEYFWNGDNRMTITQELVVAQLAYPSRVLRELEDTGTAEHGWSTLHLHYKSDPAPAAPWAVRV